MINLLCSLFKNFIDSYYLIDFLLGLQKNMEFNLALPTSGLHERFCCSVTTKDIQKCVASKLSRLDLPYAFLRVSKINFWYQINKKEVTLKQTSGCSGKHCTKKWSFPLRISSVNVTKSAGILNGKLIFLCSEGLRKTWKPFICIDNWKLIFGRKLKLSCISNRVKSNFHLTLFIFLFL